jgi:hypothetical protein
MNKMANVPLRIPLELKEFLSEDAKNNHRSMNSHMLAILEERKKNLARNEKALSTANA